MSLSFRSGVSFFVSFLMAVVPASAHGEAPSDLRALSATEKVQDLYDLLKPQRRDDTLSELYYRISVRLDPEEAAFLAGKLEKQGHLKTPSIKLEGEKIVIRSENRELRVAYNEDKNGSQIQVNDHTLTAREIQSPELRWKLIEKLVKSQNPKASFPWVNLLLPDAEAFNWMLIAAVGAVAVAGFILYKKNTKKTSVICSAPQPSCCSVNGGYVMHTNGCCQEIGGLGLGIAAACPESAGVTSSGATSSGQR